MLPGAVASLKVLAGSTKGGHRTLDLGRWVLLGSPDLGFAGLKIVLMEAYWWGTDADHGFYLQIQFLFVRDHGCRRIAVDDVWWGSNGADLVGHSMEDDVGVLPLATDGSRSGDGRL
ncbi:hypothetical protein ACLOJK_006985 [Asimina triloba]